jgi:hypothetical protein
MVMGSTGSDRFSDYPGSRSSGTGQGSGGGGASGEDRCLRAFSCNLEEIEQCEFFVTNGALPSASSQLTLEQRSRIFVVAPNGQTVGALPTTLNFLADCLAAGFAYDGRIVGSSAAPVVTVRVDFAPRQT